MLQRILLITGLAFSIIWISNAQANPNGPVHLPKQRCHASAFVTDPDPKGLNVRRGPGTKYSVLAKIPKNPNTMVELSGSTGKWLLVRYAGLESGINIFQGPGWVYGPMLGVLSMGTPYLTEGPNPHSNRLGQMADRVPLKVLSCQDKKLKVSAGRISGWLQQGEYCSNPVNTCN